MSDPRSENELYPGLILGKKYRLESEIGRGAMGTVWRAVHESLEQRVAIKIISRDHAHSEELRRRFDNEARAAAKLRSRFVVGVSDNGETHGGLPYIVMEYLDGECLEDRIARLGNVPLSEVSRITRHVVRALTKAHACGIVHRDLKPANIFISFTEDEEDGKHHWVAKVLDFGVAKMEDFGDRSATKTGTVLGTPLFMSPEQVRGASAVDGRADLYSLGMVVYNMLTGTYAFEGQSFGDLLVSICTDPLPQLSLAAPGLPPALDTWFNKACARDPDDRYQTADDLWVAFRDAIGEDDTLTPRPSFDVVSASLQKMSGPLAETFAAEDTANVGTPPSAEGTLTGVPPLEARAKKSLESAGASAVTVHEIPKNKTPLLVGLSAIFAVGALALLLFRPGSTEDPAASSAVDDPPAVDAATLEEAALMDASLPDIERQPESEVPDEADAEDPPEVSPKSSNDGDETSEAETPPPPTPASTAAPQSRPRPTVHASPPTKKVRPTPAQPRAKPTTPPKPTTRPTPAPQPRPASGQPDLGF